MPQLTNVLNLLVAAQEMERGVTLAQGGHAAGRGTYEGFAEAERMEFEGEGEAVAFCC